MKRTGPSSRRQNLDTRPAEGRTRLTRSVALGLMVFLALVVLGHLIYWDAMTAMFGTGGAGLGVLVAAIGIVALVMHLRRDGH
jgi:hypothetical protein